MVSTPLCGTKRREGPHCERVIYHDMQYRVWHHFFFSTLHAVVQVDNSEHRQVSLLNTEFNKLPRELQRLRSHIKIELRVRLSALRWFYVGHVYKIGEVSFHLIGTNGFLVRGKNCTKGRTARAARFYFLIQQIKSLIYDVVVAVAVVVSYKTPWEVQLLTLRAITLMVPLLTPHDLAICPARALISLPGCKAVAEGELAFHLFLAYTKRISRNDPWDMWSNLHLFIANFLKVNPLWNNKAERWLMTVSPVSG